MDEILASIRRIIADEDGAEGLLQANSDSVTPAEPVRQAAVVRPAPPAPPAERWQDRPISAPRPALAEARAAEPVRIASAAPSVPPASPHRAPQASASPKPLLAPETDAAVADAFDSLGALLVPAQARSVEDLMKEMLRPMLKTWLDENLPGLVEGMVRQEIERISRRGR